MAKYSIEDTTLRGIADAIRAKEQSTSSIPVVVMAERINAIGIKASDDGDGNVTLDVGGLAGLSIG
jgi:hypothetical protein